MASRPGTVDFILEQMESAGTVTARRMFGEYGIYCNERLVALVCDDKLFIKPTKAGKAFIGEVIEAPPYKGAKPYFFVSGDRWDDHEWLCKLVKVSATELPLPLNKSFKSKAKRRLGSSHNR